MLNLCMIVKNEERFNKTVIYTWVCILLIVTFLVLVSNENEFRVIALIIALLIAIFTKSFMKLFYRSMTVVGLNRKE